jgi:hypothetical protein
MITDIPNYISFPFEIGVALLILWLDKQERTREKLRLTHRTKIEVKQQARFTNFVTENSKHQMMLLESILESLDSTKAHQFKKSIQTKYSKEITSDMGDLELLLARQLDPDEDQNVIETEITHKMDEIEASRAITSTIFTEQIGKSIGNITKSTVDVLKNISLGDIVGMRRTDLQNQVNSVMKIIAKEKDHMMKEFAGFTADIQIKSDKEDESNSEKQNTLNKLLKSFVSEEDIEKLKKIAEKAKSYDKDINNSDKE